MICVDEEGDVMDEEDNVVNSSYKLREALTAAGLQDRFGWKHIMAMKSSREGKSGFRNKALSKRRSSIMGGLGKVEKHAVRFSDYVSFQLLLYKSQVYN